MKRSRHAPAGVMSEKEEVVDGARAAVDEEVVRDIAAFVNHLPSRKGP